MQISSITFYVVLYNLLESIVNSEISNDDFRIDF